MPLTIVVPERELYDEALNQFYEIPATTLVLEHSLLSISKWESKWHKPFLQVPSRFKSDVKKRSKEETLDYIRCMSINNLRNPNIVYALTAKNMEDINRYINDPMSATTINKIEKGGSSEQITSELIYYWMVALNIPFIPCEKWHLNRLLMLIEVASIKNQPSKKMSKSAVMRQNHSLNAARRAKHHTRG